MFTAALVVPSAELIELVSSQSLPSSSYCPLEPSNLMSQPIVLGLPWH